MAYIVAIGQLLEKMCLPASNEAHEEFISSLVFPYLAFAFHILPHCESAQPVDEQIARIMTNNLLNVEVIKVFKQDHKTQVLRHYLTSQVAIHSKLTKETIASALVVAFGDEETKPILTDKDVLPLLNDLRDKFQKQTTAVNQLEILLEALSQIRVDNDQHLLPVVLDLIKTVSRMSLENLSLFYLVELCSQLCISITRRAKTDLKIVSQAISDVLH